MPHLLLSFSVIAPLAFGAQDKSKGLREFTFRTGGFAVLLPEKPQKQEVPVQGQGGTQVQYGVDRENGAYIVSYQANPNLANAGDDVAAQALKQGQDAVRKSFNGKIVNQTDIKLDDKFPGREYVLDIPSRKGVLRARMYLAKGTLYQVIVVGEKAFVESSEADQVLNSFKLKK
jgi:hypothetical protein